MLSLLFFILRFFFMLMFLLIVYVRQSLKTTNNKVRTSIVFIGASPPFTDIRGHQIIRNHILLSFDCTNVGITLRTDVQMESIPYE